jgi:hypothetical protein
MEVRGLAKYNNNIYAGALLQLYRRMSPPEFEKSKSLNLKI